MIRRPDDLIIDHILKHFQAEIPKHPLTPAHVRIHCFTTFITSFEANDELRK